MSVRVEGDQKLDDVLNFGDPAKENGMKSVAAAQDAQLIVDGSPNCGP